MSDSSPPTVPACDESSPGKGPIRILIADDHDLLCDMLDLFLTGEGGFDVETVANFDEAMTLMGTRQEFDLVLLDLAMPGMNGLEGFRRMRANFVEMRVALLSGTSSTAMMREALAEGAAGFLTKTMKAQSFVDAVRQIAAGRSYFSHELCNSNTFAQQLSGREMQVLSGILQGHSNKVIALALDISEPTVKMHVRTLYRKIGASNRTQAAMIARNAGLR